MEFDIFFHKIKNPHKYLTIQETVNFMIKDGFSVSRQPGAKKPLPPISELSHDVLTF